MSDLSLMPDISFQSSQDQKVQNRTSLSQHPFVQHPKDADFLALAQHVTTATQETLHSALWPQRAQVVQRLQQMSESPDREAHRAAYQALRLLIW
jgi:hypothetical protein